MSIEDQRKLFEIRNHMVDIPANFSSSNIINKCICGDREDMKHIYICKELNIIKEETSYEIIYSDNVKEQIKVYKRFQNNMDKRSEIKEKTNIEETTSHKILLCDPLSSLSINK